MAKNQEAISAKPPPEQTPPVAPPETPSPSSLIPGLDILGRGIKVIPNQTYELKYHLLDRGDEEDGKRLPYLCSANDKLYYFLNKSVIDESPPIPEQQALDQTIIVESFERLRTLMTVDHNIAAGYGPLNINTGINLSKNFYRMQESYYYVKSSFVPLWMVYVPRSELYKPEGLTEPQIITDMKKLQEFKTPKFFPAASPTEKTDLSSRFYKYYKQEFEATNIYDTVEDFALDPKDFSLRQKAKYDAFFDTYGTHYVTRAWVGGRAVITIIVSRSSEVKEEDVKSGVNVLLSAAKAGRSAEEQSKAEHLLNNTEIVVSGIGGDKTKLAELGSSLDPKVYAEWLTSVKKAPVVIALELKGIWTLIANHDKDKAESLRKAYEHLADFRPVQTIVKTEDLVYISRGEEVRSFDVRGGILKEEKWQDFKRRFKDLTESKPREENSEASELQKTPPKLDGTDITTLQERLQIYQRIDEVRHHLDEHHFFPLDAGVVLKSPEETPERPKKAMYFFKEYKYLVYDREKDRWMGPHSIQNPLEPFWPGMTFDRVDEVLDWGDGKAYFFRGSDYIRFDLNNWKADEHYPKRIKDCWKGVMFDRIDSAVVLGQKIIFFRNDQYIVYDMIACQADLGYPKELTGLYIDETWSTVTKVLERES